MVSIFQALFNTRILVIFLMGISSGIPLLITGSTLQARMTEGGVDLTLIGIFALTGLPYTLKFLWAPVLDRFIPPFLGRRRGWAILMQGLLIMSVATLGLFNPSHSPLIVGFMALAVTFFSASQDIVLDAYRREIFADEELGLASSFFINGYRLGMLFSGAGALLLAHYLSWAEVYFILATSMMIGILVTLFAPEPGDSVLPPQSLQEAVIEPFREYFNRKGALEILAFILLYKIGDTMASAMATPFILDLGFSKGQLAAIGNTWGLAATIIGGFLGGLIIVPLGIHRSLWLFGFFQMISTLSFAFLALVGKNVGALSFAIGLENSTGGMGTAAYAAFIASLCNKRFTATQYALLSSLMGIPRVLAAAPTGFLVKQMGWFEFFIFCTLAAIPAFFLLPRIAPWKKPTLSD